MIPQEILVMISTEKPPWGDVLFYPDGTAKWNRSQDLGAGKGSDIKMAGLWCRWCSLV
jgi:hypothetical protein